MAQKDLKKRKWAFVCYPESLPENWLEILTKTGLPTAISPLHDKDNNADETEKKPHYHVILCYNNTTTYSQVKRITDSLNAPGPQGIENIRGYYRYLTHKDNPEKYQYDEKDIRKLNGFQIVDYAEPTEGEIDKIIKEIVKLIKQNDLDNYDDLSDLLFDDDEKYHVFCRRTIFFGKILDARFQKNVRNGKYPQFVKKELK